MFLAPIKLILIYKRHLYLYNGVKRGQKLFKDAGRNLWATPKIITQVVQLV